MITIRQVNVDGWCVRLDTSRQMLRLDVPDAAYHPGRDYQLWPGLPGDHGDTVSAATLLLKAKFFDDRLYAAVELAAQQGAGRFAGKAALLRSLATTLALGLPHRDVDAATTTHAACELGGLAVPIPERIADAVHAAKTQFLADELQSKPLGFYTWTPELTAIFHQDRFLQQLLESEVAEALANAMAQTPTAPLTYKTILQLAARLTNPAKKLGIRDAEKSPPFFPPSRSHEISLFESLYENRPIPAKFDLMSELIRCIRSGKISLMPTDKSGWYDHQTWSLEPLVVPDRRPEIAHLDLSNRYRKHLEDLFRGALALARETHVKQGGGGRGGYAGFIEQRPIRIHPGLTVEPIPTLYARRAAGYAFVRSVLEETFGVDALQALRRIHPDGTSTGGLAEELAWIETLFAGAAATSRHELGMEPLDPGNVAVRCFAAWRASMWSDKDLSRDARTMVPVFYDEGRRKTKVWAFLGWTTTNVVVEYGVRPVVLSVTPEKGKGKPPANPPSVLFTKDQYDFAAPVMAEVYVSRLMNRDEFRQHCNRYKSKDRILANLR